MKILGWAAVLWAIAFLFTLLCMAKIAQRKMPNEMDEHVEEFGREEPVMAISSRRNDMPDARVIAFPSIPKETQPKYVDDEELLHVASLWDLDELKREIDQYDLAAAEYERRAERQRHIAEVLRGYVNSL